MTNIKISELNLINKSDLQPDDIFLVVRSGQWDKVISHSQLFRLSTDNLVDGILPVERGGAGSDLSQTGGMRHYVKQLAEGAGLTTGLIQEGDIPTSLPLTVVGGTNSLNIGTQSSDIIIGNELSNDYIYGLNVEINSDLLELISDSILLNGSNVNIGINNNSDILIQGDLSITGNELLMGNLIVNNINCNTILSSGSMSATNINCNNAILSGSLSCGSATMTSVNTNNLLMSQLVNQQLLYGNNGQLLTLGSASNTLIGYDSNSLTKYTGSQVATLIGTNSIDGIAKTNISINNANIGAEKTINFIPSGLTMTGVDSGTQVDLTLSVAAGDNTASKIYLWSNYR